MQEGYTQLIMRRPNLDGLPDLVIPDGYTLRTYKDGDEAAWDAIVGPMSSKGFINEIKNHRFFSPERVKLICRDDVPVATATAWEDEGGDLTTAVVHMVGTDTAYRGQGLGFAVTNAVLHHMQRQGKASVYLSTDDFRVPAIKIYLKLGFEPDLTKPGHTERWEILHKKLAGGEGA